MQVFSTFVCAECGKHTAPSTTTPVGAGHARPATSPPPAVNLPPLTHSPKPPNPATRLAAHPPIICARQPPSPQYTPCPKELIAAFDRFRAQNVTDLILDLRYNNGGDVLSSTVLGTLIAGEAYKGQLYAHMTFNEDRTEAGESGDYKIGVKETFESVYEPIERALQHALGLKKIYVLVSETTASASEMVINGLRGLILRSILSGCPLTVRT